MDEEVICAPTPAQVQTEDDLIRELMKNKDIIKE